MSTLLRAWLFGGLILNGAFVLAEEIRWKVPVSGDARDEENWQPAVVPGPQDTVIFDLRSSGYAVEVGQLEIARLLVNNDTVTLERQALVARDLNEPAVSLANSAGEVAKLILSDRVHLLGSQILIGAHADSEATLRLDDAEVDTSTRWAPSDRGKLVVGAAGKGTLTVDEGSVVTGHLIIARDALSQGAATIDSAQGQSSLNAAAITIGQGGNGALTATDFSRIDVGGPVVLAEHAGSHGKLDISGRSSQVFMNGGLTVGKSGIAEMTVTDSGWTRVDGAMMVGEDVGSQGSLAISGRTVWFGPSTEITAVTIGGEGHGAVSVREASQALLSGPVVIGQASSAEGSLVVDGRNTILAPVGFGSPPKMSLTVGDAGSGSLEVTGGAEMEAGGTVIVGNKPNSIGRMRVDGADSSFGSAGYGAQNIDKVIVGAEGSGELTISGEAEASFYAPLVIGESAGSTGTVTVGGRARLEAYEIRIAPGGSGSLSILNAATVDATHGAVEIHGQGRVEIDSSTLDASDFGVNNAGELINNGLINGSVTNLPGGIYSGTGTVIDTLSLSGGTLAPGNSPGRMNVGALDFEQGTFQFEINSVNGVAGPVPDAGPGWDLVAVEGDATFYGPLTVALVSLTTANDPGDVFDFDPSSNYQWTFLTAGIGLWNFDPEQLTIDTSGFSNDFSGRFFVSRIGNSLAVNYQVPEPSTAVLAVVGIAALLAIRRRKARR